MKILPDFVEVQRLPTGLQNQNRVRIITKYAINPPFLGTDSPHLAILDLKLSAPQTAFVTYANSAPGQKPVYLNG